MKPLTELQLSVLELLPGEPNGLSMMELAEGVFDVTSLSNRDKIAKALAKIGKALAPLGGLCSHRGNDDFSGYEVKLYSISHKAMPSVRELFKAISRRTSTGSSNDLYFL